jgi:hypothetical protein
MNLEVKNKQKDEEKSKKTNISWACNEVQSLPLLETLLKPQNWFVKSDLY